MHIVSRACQNRSLGNSQAEPEYFFPLVISDLNEGFVKKIIPLIVPTMPTHGLVLLGRAGIGKTPLAIVLGLALARHYVATRGPAEAIVGWRRSKQIDGFRERPGELHVPVLLDDPILSGMTFEDLKSFLDVGETCLVDARYKAAKFVRNQTRILLTNEWSPDSEPDLDFHTRIGWKDFKNMISSAFNAVYVRLPSEHQSQDIYRFEGDGLTVDWISDKHKAYYGKFKDGNQQVKYPGFEEALEQEAMLIGNLLASDEEKEYMRRGATYDSWLADYDTSHDPEHPADSAPSSPPRPSAAAAASSSPPIRSPPRKMHKTDEGLDADEEIARASVTQKKSHLASVPYVRHEGYAGGRGVRHTGQKYPKYGCNRWRCQVYISPVQACVLLMKVQDISTPAICQTMNANHKLVEDMGTRLMYAREEYVNFYQKKIILGSHRATDTCIRYWTDVEGDEASFVKTDVSGNSSKANPDQAIQWEQWLGLVQPGVEWLPIARKYLKGKRVILHTDAARSYTTKVEGVLHDNVVHAKKRILVKGKMCWVRPNYVKAVTHKLPGKSGKSETVQVKAGTQVIDRAWRFLKDRLSLNQHAKAGPKQLRAQIRAAQFQYWKKDEDPWVAACSLSKFIMQKLMMN
ncbi:CCR3, partial [Symbiodinium necroappetens]